MVQIPHHRGQKNGHVRNIKQNYLCQGWGCERVQSTDHV